MATTRKRATTDDVVERLDKQLIIQLGLAGVPQRRIREIVECDLNRVTRIVRLLPRRTPRETE